MLGSNGRKEASKQNVVMLYLRVVVVDTYIHTYFSSCHSEGETENISMLLTHSLSSVLVTNGFLEIGSTGLYRGVLESCSVACRIYAMCYCLFVCCVPLFYKSLLVLSEPTSLEFEIQTTT